MSDNKQRSELLKGKSRRSNSRRHGYELAPRRDVTSPAIIAGIIAGVVHLVLIYFSPQLLSLTGAQEIFNKEVKEEVARVFVNPKKDEEIAEATPEPPPEDTPEPEEIVYEPAEIDILDAEMEELVMAPGKTEIALPKPVITDDASAADAEAAMVPTEFDASAFHTEPVPPQDLAVAEPSPVNANDVIANVDAKPEDVEAANDNVERELRESAAKEGKEGLPSDTRSLAELLGEADPGSKSGVARLGADVLFGFNESKLRNSARITMLQLAALIQKNPQTYFLIEGHTDSIGGEAYNDLLGLLRAAAVRDWLVSNNIPVQYVYIRSCGYRQPLVDVNLSKEEQELNRRVEIHMRKGGEQMPEGAVPSTHKVDTSTSVSAQIAKGVRAPQTSALTLKEPAKPKMPDFKTAQGEADIPLLPELAAAAAQKSSAASAKPTQSAATKSTKPAPAAKTTGSTPKKPTSKTGAAALKKLQNNAKKAPATKNGKKR